MRWIPPRKRLVNMPCGYNQLVKLITYSYPSDDPIGGSQPSGTLFLDSVLVRIEPMKPSTVLLEQGIETTKLFETTITYRAKGVKENDELLVYAPKESEYYDQHFRVVSVRHPSLRPNDPRGQIYLILKRFETAHANQYG